VNSRWVYGGTGNYIPTGQKTYDWEYGTPLAKMEIYSNPGLPIRIFWTNYGRQYGMRIGDRIPNNCKYSMIVNEMDFAGNRMRMVAFSCWDFSGNMISDDRTEQAWFSPDSGTVYERWMQIARTLPISQ
jgi:hypothetical protein